MRRSRTLGVLGAFIVIAGIAVTTAGPVRAAAPQSRHQIVITSDAGWTAAQGVRSGSGTARDPYVISDWRVSTIRISDTSAHYVLRDNIVSGTMTLNWTGAGATVVDNSAINLRVNENVDRTGAPTSGLIARNTFDIVGQLRHFDGVFEDNKVGRSRSSMPLFNVRAVNFDGFNGARFRNNTIYGYVDVKLHGHHHGSGYGHESHMHSSHGEHGVDHTQRYHQVWVTGNTIYSDARYALGFNDQAHQANDRTAASEENPELNKPHTHYTKVHLNGNELIGAGLDVNIFNAVDNEKHPSYARGKLDIKNNVVSLARKIEQAVQQKAGISVRTARTVDIVIAGNEVTGTYEGGSLLDQGRSDVGIALDTIEEAFVQVTNNAVSDLGIGVQARRFKASTWVLEGLTARNVGTPVNSDGSAQPQP